MNRARHIVGFLLPVLFMLVSGCGGGGGSTTAVPLSSITVSGGNATTTLGGQEQQYTATGTYADGTVEDLTTTAAWSSSNTAVASISNTSGSQGKATPVGGGTTTISAQFKGVTGSVGLTVLTIGGGSQGTPLVLSGTVVTIAGSAAADPAVVPWADGTGAVARFNQPVGITTDGRYLYIADCANNRIRKVVIATGVVTTLAGTGARGSVDVSPGIAAQFYNPRGITTDGTWLYVTEMATNKIRRVNIASGTVTTLVTTPALSTPTGITTDGTYLYVANSGTNSIVKVVIANGTMTPVANFVFNQPTGITTDGTNLYVNDFGNSAVKKIVIASGLVTTLTTQVTNPATGITTDGTYLYVADYGGHTIRRVAIADGAVTVLAGSNTGIPGMSDGIGAGALFRLPEGITSDGRSLYISDSGNNTIRRLQ